VRIVSFRVPGGVPRPGRVDDSGGIVDLAAVAPDVPALLADADALARAEEHDDVALDPDDVLLLPPVWNPGKIVCVGVNYADHAEEMGRQRPDYPVLFARFTTTLVAHGQPIVRPRLSEQLDYEGELVAVIGRRGRHVPRADALAHVAGYSVFNDASVRDYQRRTSQFTPGKNFDATGGFGPWVVTADELPPGAAGLELQTRVGDEVLQSASTSLLLFDVADLVALVSDVCTLEPGDLLVTGTPGGVGAARTPPRWLVPGETVEVEIEGIGTLRNPIVDETG